MKTVEELSVHVGRSEACRSLGVPRASFYRAVRSAAIDKKPPKRGPSPRALSPEERQEVLDVLHSERFVDRSPAETYATLLDEKKYLCSERSMYRILEKAGEVRERRNQRRHVEYKKPELLATAPNAVWSWDITKLLGPVKWTYFYLYVILDIYSRYVVGWMLAEKESASLAKRLIEETCFRQGIEEGRLILHSDRGPSMKSKTVAQLLGSLGVTKSHSRPYVSDDNPFSESQFKTLKYFPGFPKRFGSIEDGHVFLRPFFRWYNEAHRHSGIGMLTPETVHMGRAAEVRAGRQATLAAAYAVHPERFVNKFPSPPALPVAVWINPPKNDQETPAITDAMAVSPEATEVLSQKRTALVAVR